MTQPNPPNLHPSMDPRQSINAFARLLARLAEPFVNRADELARSSLIESELDALTSRWSARIQADPAAIVLFETAYAAQKEHLVELETDGAGSHRRPSRFDQELPSEAMRARLEGNAPEACETLPITDPVGEALPFQAGVYRPLPPLSRLKEGRRRADDPDATRLPVANPDATLPFATVPDIENKSTKR